MGKTLSKLSPIPLYIQVADSLREQIITGVFQPGSILPKEQTMVETYQASRITIRNALDLLVEEGIIVKRQGKGTFVTDLKKTVSLDSVQGFYSLLVKSGAKIKTQLQNTESVIPSKEIITALALVEPLSVRKIERLYIAEQQPIALITTHFYRDVDLNTEEAQNLTAYGVLVEKIEIEPHDAKYGISATQSSSQLSKIMEIDKGAPILIFESN